MVLKCNCNHEYQDEEYGKNNRVHNKMEKSVNEKYMYRCTVCSKERYG